jgi:hypothetical protein
MSMSFGQEKSKVVLPEVWSFRDEIINPNLSELRTK